MKQFPSLLRCRLSRKQLVRLLTPVLAFAPIVNAADVSKANNVDALNLDTSWTSGALPTATDVAVFDSTVTDIPEDGTTGFRLMSFPVAASWQGIRVVGAVDKLSIDSFGLGLPALTIGSAGIDLSSALTGTTFDLFGQAITLDAPQTWRVADGATLSIGGGSLARAAGANLEIVLGTGAIKFESGNLGTYATLNDTHYAGVDAVTKLVVPATYADYASGGNLAGTYTGILNVTGTTTGATQAWRQSNSFTVSSGVRFGQNNTQNTRWTVDTSSGGRLITTPSVLVGAAVTQNIEFNGSGGIRAAASASELLIQNFGSGTVIFNTIINNPTSGSHALTKIGPGGLTIASNSGYNGATRINEGVFQIGNGGATGDIGDASAVTVNTSLVFNRTGVLAFPNTITGSGSLSLAGSGEIQLTGANSFSGPVGLGGGTLTFSNTGNLGAGTALNFTGGALRWATGNTTDISATHTLAFGLGGAGIDTNGQDLVFGSPFGAGGAGGLRKNGAGTLTLQSGSTFQGANTVNAGTLALANASGSATGSGDITVAAGATLSGTGAAAGTASFGNNAILTPGLNGVGSLTLGGLTLNTGAVVNLEFDGGANDQVVTTATGGLTINGGGVNLYAAGGVSPLTAPGTYNLIQYAGTIQGAGPSALSVLNTQPGYAYTFGANAGFLTLQVILDSILSGWTGGAGSWASSANWSNGVAASGYTAQFNTPLVAPATVTLDGSRTVNGIVFAGAQPYTLAVGTGGELTLSKTSGSVLVSVGGGDHVISAPVVLSSSLTAATDAGSSLTVSGVVSGPGGVAKTGTGLLSLTAANTFAGPVSVGGGTLAFGLPSSLGTGAITLDGGAVRFLDGNTADLSNRAFTLGVNGGTIDTNGNDVIFMNPIGGGGVGSLTKAGDGILALDAVNTFAGGLTVTGGAVRIASDAALGTAGSTLTLNGGTLSTGSLTLATDTTNRPLVLGANGGTVSVETGATLVLLSSPSGSGSLTKDGSGTLNLPTGSSRSSGTTLRGGTLHLAGDVNFGNSTGFLGSGALTLEGGTLNSALTPNNSLTFGNALVVPSGATATFVAPNRMSMQGAVSGAGTLEFHVQSDAARTDLANSFTGFSGQINFRNLRAGSAATGVRLLSNNAPAFNAASFAGSRIQLDPGVSLLTRTNSTGNTIAIGALSGGAGTSLTTEVVAGGGRATYQIGALNTDSVFNGALLDGPQGINLTKVGTGSLTLTAENTTVGVYNVNAGTLLLDGANTSVASTNVAVGATLGGTGSLGGTVAVTGTLRPDPTGAKGGRFTLPGSLTLAGSTQFDFGGKSFTGISYTSGSALVFGGALNLAFTGSVFNGTYELFSSTGGLTGNFTGGVTATSLATPTAVVLADTAGSWTGSIDGASLSFDPATGILTVTGGAEAITPGSTSALVATGGNAVVNLSWPELSGANTYTLSRSSSASGPFAQVVSGLTNTAFADTTVLNGTTYYYTVTGTNTASGLVGNASNIASATPTAVVYTALQNWRFAEFGVYDDDGTVLAGDNEDFDGDGMVNILEYALDTNPKVVNASPVVVGRSGNFLTLTYPRKATADVALSYTVEGTTALGTTAFATGTGATNTVGTTSTYTDDVDLTTNPRRFLRLSINYTAPTP
jgi:autotransporter-associated beta strand protein